MNDELFLDLDSDVGDDLRIKFDGVTYTLAEPNLIQWDAIGKSLQKMSGLGGLISETVETIVGDADTDEGVLARILKNADTLWSKLFETIGADFFDGMADTCVAVLMTQDNVAAWADVQGIDLKDLESYDKRPGTKKIWRSNELFEDYLREKLNLRIASGVLRAAWQRSGVFDAMGKLLMARTQTEAPSE